MNREAYDNNLKKEEAENSIFVQWCRCHRWRFRRNEGELNYRGSDFTIQKGSRHYEVDLKGCKKGYRTVVLSYASSIDGVTWYNPLVEHDLTDFYVFIDDDSIVGWISKKDVLRNYDRYRKTSASDDRAGKFQKLILIPKEELHRGPLNDDDFINYFL